MQGLYICVDQSMKNDKSGVGLKVRNQMKSFNQAGLEFEEYILPMNHSKLLPILYRLPFFNVYPIWKYSDVFENVKYIYMRRPFVMTVYMRRVLKRIRKKNPTAKIVIEIPTYPYDEEYNTYKLNWMLKRKDCYNRNRMNGLVDHWSIVNNEDKIFGINTIKIKNGIDVDAIKPRAPIETGDTIHFCAVAMFKEWHGYERFFYGLAEYYKKGGSRNMISHFVGEGSELPFYHKLVRELNLDQHVVFHGYLSGKELEKIYDLADISLGSFGMFKQNLNLSCNLKSRESVARGVPMVTGCPTDIFQKDKFKYYLEFPNDESVLDINRILDFYDAIYGGDESKEEVVKTIRKYAYEQIDMSKCMEPVITYFKGCESQE